MAEASLFTDSPIPCFRLGIYPVHSRGVVIKGIDGLKSAVRPFGLNQPLITVTQCDVKKGLPAVGLISRVPRSLIEPRPRVEPDDLTTLCGERETFRLAIQIAEPPRIKERDSAATCREI